MKTAIILGGSLTLFVALAGLFMIVLDQLIGRRRPLTLALATGVSRTMIARSLMIGITITSLTGTVLGATMGTLLATYIEGAFSGLITVSFGPAIYVSLITILATLFIAAIALLAIPRLIRFETLRTE